MSPTPKQYELLVFLDNYQTTHGYAPSYIEMKDGVGLKTKSGIHRLLKGLAQRGFIKTTYGLSRSVEILKFPSGSLEPMASEIEDKLAFQLTRATSFWVSRQYRFHKTRMWRCDFAIWLHEPGPYDLPLLVEIEGARRGKPGRHQRVDGMDADCEKYAEAIIAGYTLLRVSGRMVRDGRALRFIERLLLPPE